MVRARCSDLALKRPDVVGTAVEIAPGSTVGVYEDGTGGTLSEVALPQTLYADKTGLTTLTNPFPVATDGSFAFYVDAPAACDLKITLPDDGGEVVVPHVPIIADPGDLEARISRLSPTLVNVQSFGAVPDGTTECAGFMQSAFDEGGTVVIPFETGDVGYKISTPLAIGDGTATTWSTLQGVRVIGLGSGVATRPDPTSQKVENTLEGFAKLLWYGSAGERMLEVRGPIQNVEITGLGFDCRLLASCAIRTYDLQVSTIRWCKAIDFTNCVSATGDQRTLTGAFHFDAYSVGDASPNSALSSDNGGNICTFELLFAVSIFGTRPAGFVVGEADPPAVDGTNPNWPSAPGGSPDVSQVKFINCYTRTANQAGSVGLALRYTDSISFEQCSFPALIPVSVELPASATALNGLTVFPNYIGMKHVHVDNGRSPGTTGAGTGSWNDCRIIVPGGQTWDAEHKLIFEPAVNGLDGDYGAALANFGYGWTAHDKTSGYSGWIGKLHVGGDFKTGGAIQATGDVTAVGGAVTSATNMIAGTRIYPGSNASGATYYEDVLFFGTLNNTGALIDLGTRHGTLEVTNVSAGQQCSVYVNGIGHGVAQQSSSITGFALTDSGTGIAIYWDGVSAYKIKNRSATNPASLRVFFRGTDS